MVKRFVKVALCQRGVTGSKEQNIAETVSMIEEAAEHCPGLDLIIFPEYNYYEALSLEEARANSETMDGRYITEMKKQARRFGVNLIPGSFAETCGEKVKNTCALIDRSGEVAGSYSKVHLMDAIGIRESDAAVPGDKLGVFDTDFGRIGLMVCFDLRFPEQPRSMVLQGADIIFCAASFPTGSPLPPRTDHWDLLVQSTALLNLTWTCAVNQFGSICGGTENPFGRSMVVDPWGIVTASALGRRDIVYATLDMQHQKEIRGRVATWNCRRPDIYTL
ncbi:carbon-nitrogen hydrolase [Eubacteriales bacterium]|nr:hypothetical protein [Oscillospiraceae bacterium]MCM0705485.1 hypothetical protein [Faecalicatena sp. BF-R-105]GKH49107.1 carbon-nitrogen hydrolase [Eubacteriales bacterium]GKH61749.1 carbon-nitrogen hydrolase [Eubacteriales bacterium]SFI79245.1 Predicted amidohydrolase [Ruminococcaceae bacterium D5]